MAQNQTKKSRSSKTNSSDKDLPKREETMTKETSEKGQAPMESSRRMSGQAKSMLESPRKSLEHSNRQDRGSTEVAKKQTDPVKNQAEPAKGQGAKSKTSPTKKLLKIERNQTEAKKMLCQMNSQLTELLLGRPNLTESPTDLTRRSLIEIQNLGKDILALLGGSGKKPGCFLEETRRLLGDFEKLKQLYQKSESNLKSEKDLVKFYTSKCRAYQNESEKLKVEKKQIEEKIKECEDKIIELENTIVQTKQSHHNGIRILTDKQAGLQEKLNKCESSLISTTEKNKELLEENQSLKDKILDLEQKHKSLEKKCVNYHKDIEKITHKNKLLDNRNKKMQSEMDMMNVRNIELRTKNKSILKESNHTDERIRELDEKVSKLSTELNTSYSEVDHLREECHALKARLSDYENENESDLMKIEDYTEALHEQEVKMNFRRRNSEHSVISCANSGLSSTLDSQGRASRLTRPPSGISDVSFANSSHSDEVPR